MPINTNFIYRVSQTNGVSIVNFLYPYTVYETQNTKYAISIRKRDTNTKRKIRKQLVYCVMSNGIPNPK